MRKSIDRSSMIFLYNKIDMHQTGEFFDIYYREEKFSLYN